VIRGLTHNIPLLRDVLTEPTFNSGTFTTSYLQETYPDGFQVVQLSQADKVAIASLAAVCHCKEAERARLSEAQAQ
jgi:propionyl-CoA carboxylase alpha chain